ncbi:hypothetical protein Hrd1104_05335 [Halorhabdus sp. CBA1104]|uniref:DUF5802 family protein n=1 Tax=unclassified Halorhabdus TaxID=2621901 RepID=UPI0012B2A7F2|nr:MULTISPECIES: DUF5802 family protein [unclassified Halorhabdus]QGN06773.1 hypothetical protein Hrd1104_05335 [Halorhabdus sp. CBA1104]
MFEQFSRSYYLGRLYVQSGKRETAVMCDQQYQHVHTQLYGQSPPASDGHPLVMKLGSRHFPVTGARSVPSDTLAVPPDVLTDTPVEHPPALREVLLATEDRAEQLLALVGVANEPAGI